MGSLAIGGHSRLPTKSQNQGGRAAVPINTWGSWEAPQVITVTYLMEATPLKLGPLVQVVSGVKLLNIALRSFHLGGIPQGLEQ